MDYPKHMDLPGFEILKKDPYPHIHASNDHYVYFNLNPQQKECEYDEVYQVMRFFRDDLTNEGIMDLITDYRVKHGIMRMSSSDVLRFINKNLQFPYYKLDVPITARDFVDGVYKMIDSTGWIIVKMGKKIELFNLDDGKFYSSNPIYIGDNVRGYWTTEGGPYGREAKHDIFSLL